MACIGEERNAEGFLTGKAEARRPLTKLRRRREDNIEMVLTDIGSTGKC
jgi:hypothetical protein